MSIWDTKITVLKLFNDRRISWNCTATLRYISLVKRIRRAPLFLHSSKTFSTKSFNPFTPCSLRTLEYPLILLVLQYSLNSLALIEEDAETRRWGDAESLLSDRRRFSGLNSGRVSVKSRNSFPASERPRVSASLIFWMSRAAAPTD